MSMRVLFVEDDPDLLALYREVAGDVADVLAALSYEEAVRLLQDEPVDMVFADFQLGGKTGLDLLHWIKERNPALARCFVLLCGLPPDVPIDCEVISKPVAMEVLLQHITARKADSPTC